MPTIPEIRQRPSRPLRLHRCRRQGRLCGSEPQARQQPRRGRWRDVNAGDGRLNIASRTRLPYGRAGYAHLFLRQRLAHRFPLETIPLLAGTGIGDRLANRSKRSHTHTHSEIVLGHSEGQLGMLLYWPSGLSGSSQRCMQKAEGMRVTYGEAHMYFYLFKRANSTRGVLDGYTYKERCDMMSDMIGQYRNLITPQWAVYSRPCKPVNNRLLCCSKQ